MNAKNKKITGVVLAAVLLLCTVLVWWFALRSKPKPLLRFTPSGTVPGPAWFDAGSPVRLPVDADAPVSSGVDAGCTSDAGDAAQLLTPSASAHRASGGTSCAAYCSRAVAVPCVRFCDR